MPDMYRRHETSALYVTAFFCGRGWGWEMGVLLEYINKISTLVYISFLSILTKITLRYI